MRADIVSTAATGRPSPSAAVMRADAGLVLSHAGRVRDQRPDAKRQRQAEREGAGERPGDEDVTRLNTPRALRDGIEDDDASHEATDYRAIWYISRGPPGFRRRSCHVREASCRSCRWRCWRSSLPPAAPLSLLSRRPEVAMARRP